MESLGPHKPALALASGAGSRLPVNGAFMNGKRLIPRLYPTSRCVIVYSI